MVRLRTAQVDCSCDVVVVHRVDASNNILNHAGSKRVKAMFPVHLDNAEVTVELSVNIE